MFTLQIVSFDDIKQMLTVLIFADNFWPQLF